MQIIGHRGAAGIAPENTIRSIREALGCNVDAVEVDVAICRSGEIILMHDTSVDRTTNGKGYVTDLDFQQLRNLTVGGTEQVPTLLEAIEEIDGRVPLNIEIKGRGSSYGVCALLKELISTGKRAEQDFIVSSFNHIELLEVQNIMPGIRISPIISCTPLDISCIIGTLRPWSVNIDISAVTEEMVAQLHNQRIKVLVFTVNTPEQFKKMESIGADGIFTDNSKNL